MRELLPLLMKGTLVTIEIAVYSILLAIVMAFVAPRSQGAVAPLRWVGNVYVEMFRGTSLLVQLFWFFFVLPLPPFNLELAPFTVAIVGLGLHYGAYGSEILRGALRSVPGGQFEAALALNLPATTRMRRIILPQAMINALPPATNLMIELLKGTSLVSLITLSDLTFRARQLDESDLQDRRDICADARDLLRARAVFSYADASFRAPRSSHGASHARGSPDESASSICTTPRTSCRICCAHRCTRFCITHGRLCDRARARPRARDLAAQPYQALSRAVGLLR